MAEAYLGYAVRLAESGHLCSFATHDWEARKGHRTREYVVFGTEWWLYVRNRIAEDPQRLLQALVDAAS